MPPPVFAAPFASSADFLTAFDAEIAKAGLLVRAASVGNAPAMSVQQKFQLALSGARDERLALFRDPNKPVHVFILRSAISTSSAFAIFSSHSSVGDFRPPMMFQK